MNANVKEVVKESPKAVCSFCHSSKVNSLEYGPLYQCQLDGITVHYFCVLLSAGLSQNGEDDEGICGFLPKDIRKELRRGDRLKCKYCRKWNATIGCWVKTCQTSYHYNCGLKNGCGFQFIGEYESYCSKHTNKIKVPEGLNDPCPICLCKFSKKDSVICPPCCKKQEGTPKLIHKRCVLKMGRNHGLHFFKCPLCNDKKIFTEAMMKEGIYLPERDAAWETEPDAFAEQREKYSRCDAGKCHCPKGREHSSKTGSKPWKIVRCGSCGSSAIHKYCGRLKNLSWRCGTCAEIFQGKKVSGEMNSSRIQRHRYDTASSDGEKEDLEMESNPSKKIRLDLAEEDSSSSESTPEPASSKSSDSELGRNGNKRLNSGNGMKFDDDDSAEQSSGSTEDEEDDLYDGMPMIDPSSNVYKQLYGARADRKAAALAPVIVTSSVALRRSSEEVKYPDSMETWNRDCSTSSPLVSPSSARAVFQDDLVQLMEIKNRAVVASSSKSQNAPEDEAKVLMGEDKTSPGPSSEDLALAAHLPPSQFHSEAGNFMNVGGVGDYPDCHQVELEEWNFQEEEQEQESSDAGISILNCFSLAPPIQGSSSSAQKADGPTLSIGPSADSKSDPSKKSNKGEGEGVNNEADGKDDDDSDSDIEILSENLPPPQPPKSKPVPAILGLVRKWELRQKENLKPAVVSPLQSAPVRELDGRIYYPNPVFQRLEKKMNQEAGPEPRKEEDNSIRTSASAAAAPAKPKTSQPEIIELDSDSDGDWTPVTRDMLKLENVEEESRADKRKRGDGEEN